MMDYLLILLLPVCIAASFLCSGMEAGVFALGRWRIAQQMRAGKKSATRLYRYLENTENFLWTILLGNTLAAFFALWIVALALVEELPDRPFVFLMAFAGTVFIFYIFCDLLPKMLFRMFPNRLSLVMSTPFQFLHLALSPVVAMIEGLANLLLKWTGGKVFTGHVFSNRAELRLMLQDPKQDLTIEERGMITRVLDLQSLTVRQMAVPMERFPSVRQEEPATAALARFREEDVALMPVWAGSGRQRRMAGVLDLKSLLFQESFAPGETVGTYATPAMYIEEDVRVQEALRRLQRSGQRIAVVLGRDRRELGLITLEGILKVIFGEVKL